MRIRELFSNRELNQFGQEGVTHLLTTVLRLLVPQRQEFTSSNTLTAHKEGESPAAETQLFSEDTRNLEDLYPIDDVHPELPSSHPFREYTLIDGAPIHQVVADLQAEVAELKIGEVSVVFVIGSPGSGKSELIDRIKQHILKVALSTEEIENFSWESFAEKEYRATLSLEEQRNPTFSDQRLKEANIRIVNRFKAFLEEHQGMKVLLVELPISSGNLKDFKNPVDPLNPDSWYGRMAGELVLFKTVVDHHYPGLKPRVIAAYPGAVLIFKDILRENGAPISVIKKYFAQVHVAMERFLAQKQLTLPAYAATHIGPESINHVFENPMDDPNFRRKFGRNLLSTLNHIMPHDLSLEQKRSYLGIFARYVALSEARALFMVHLLKNMYKLPPHIRSVVMVMPEPDQLGAEPEVADTKFRQSIGRVAKSERIM